MLVQSVASGILGTFKAETSPQQKQIWLVQATVSHAAGVSLQALCAPTRRSPHVASARQMAMYLCHVVFSISISDVARAFGRDPSTVVHALQRVEEMRDNVEQDRELDMLETFLTDSWSRS